MDDIRGPQEAARFLGADREELRVIGEMLRSGGKLFFAIPTSTSFELALLRRHLWGAEGRDEDTTAATGRPLVATVLLLLLCRIRVALAASRAASLREPNSRVRMFWWNITANKHYHESASARVSRSPAQEQLGPDGVRGTEAQ